MRRRVPGMCSLVHQNGRLTAETRVRRGTVISRKMFSKKRATNNMRPR
jgi:hypothetical protein